MSGVDRQRSEKVFSGKLLFGWKCLAGARGPKENGHKQKAKATPVTTQANWGLQNLWTHLCPPLKQMAHSSEDHCGWLSWTLRTESRDHNSLRVTTIEQQTTKRNFVLCDDSRSLLPRKWWSYQWLFTADKQSCNKAQDFSDLCFEHRNEITVIKVASAVTRSLANQTPSENLKPLCVDFMLTET